jgi:hypothetical protein
MATSSARGAIEADTTPRERAIPIIAAELEECFPSIRGEERIYAKAALNALAEHPEVLRALADQTTPAEPGYERIADAIFHACEAAGLDLIVTRGFDPVDGPEAVLARVLDKAGLIDWNAFREETRDAR